VVGSNLDLVRRCLDELTIAKERWYLPSPLTVRGKHCREWHCNYGVAYADILVVLRELVDMGRAEMRMEPSDGMRDDDVIAVVPGDVPQDYGSPSQK
jgi:hypothetical protein